MEVTGAKAETAEAPAAEAKPAEAAAEKKEEAAPAAEEKKEEMSDEQLTMLKAESRDSSLYVHKVKRAVRQAAFDDIDTNSSKFIEAAELKTAAWLHCSEGLTSAKPPSLKTLGIGQNESGPLRRPNRCCLQACLPCTALSGRMSMA